MCDHVPVTRRGFLGCAAGAASVALLGSHAGWGRSLILSQDAPPDADRAAWDALAELAIRTIRAGGADYGDIRLLLSTGRSLNGRDRRIANISDRRDAGFGIRVLYRGAWGFSAGSLVTEAEIERVAAEALAIARGSASRITEPARLAPEPPHRDTVRTALKVDPFAIPLAEQAAMLQAAMDAMQSTPGVARSSASIWMQRDQKLFASTEGAQIHFDLVAIQGGLRATALHEGRFASRGFTTGHQRTGFELIRAADLLAQAPRVAADAVEKVRAPEVAPGAYDLVLDGPHLSLTIHESCGHPTELDRALGWEANYAGTSFLTPDKLGKFQYGSKHVNLVADNTETGFLASTGYDDDGVAGQKWDIVREGRFVGYSTSREVAPLIGLPRSTGSSRADSWQSVPIVRIANIGLEPGSGSPDELIADVKRGILIEGHGSFSIDQRRYNFQFGGDAFWLIENGKRKGMLRDVIYTGITPEFWNSCDAVAGPDHRTRHGFINCGKGQPGQSGWMTHAAATARFRGVNVITGKTLS